MATRYDEVRMQMLAVDMLRFLKHTCRLKYSQLSKLTGLPATVLSRYITGHNLPGPQRAARLLRTITKKMSFDGLVSQLVRVDSNGMVDMTALLFDTRALKLIVTKWVDRLAGRKVTKVLTMEPGGVPLATALAYELSVPLAVVRRSKEVGVEEHYRHEEHTPYGVEVFYLPKNALRNRDWVLLVNDLVRTGRSLRIMMEFVKRARARSVGFLAAVGVKGWDAAVASVLPDGTLVDVALVVRV